MTARNTSSFVSALFTEKEEKQKQPKGNAVGKGIINKSLQHQAFKHKKRRRSNTDEGIVQGNSKEGMNWKN